ncbi:biopolymer transport protein [Bernardetia litoralis DSM 6794]|uniref:Biopolymer transport protein n=1 Tax=Bernardetia litoralis (strain ATCC 23117 / DSM 6794 / NBRC 15988 / NCIMB 1366 / Fx l1 / Sio-4) TaxID=880071 RepID=I4AMX3_BERLS|nr:biopolymer transporter ExbD [Bernardetia litoralis]AFM05308.1 biopolymer transport protein [Bernardetia litoralis DSM 6794]
MISNREKTTVNASSMADIAFLLLIFFLVSTRIASEKGLTMSLPQKQEQKVQPTPALDRDVLRISINSENKILIESNKNATISEIKSLIKTHVMNYGIDANYSQNPQKAVVVLSSQRQTNYNFYIEVLDKIKAGYNDAKAVFLTKKLGAKYTPLEVIDFALQKTQKEKELYQLLKKEIPVTILEQNNSL